MAIAPSVCRSDLTRKFFLAFLTCASFIFPAQVIGESATSKKNASIEEYLDALSKFKALINSDPAKVVMPRVDQVPPAPQWTILGDYEKYLDAWAFELTDLTLLLGLCSQTH